jgi:uncharacterized protein with NRDE domain
MCWRKDSLFNKWWWENWISTCRRLKLDPYLSSYTYSNSNWIKDFNIRSKTLKLLQERIRKRPEHIGTGNNFLNKTPVAQQIRDRIDQWDYVKLKSFCTQSLD